MKFSKNTPSNFRYFLLFSVGFMLPLLTYTFEEMKLLLLLGLATAVYAVRNFKNHRFVSIKALTIVAGLLAGFPVRQNAHPAIEASLWARSTESTLCTKKLDSLIAANQIPQKIIRKKEIREEGRTKPRIISALLAFLMFIVTYGFFYLTIAAIFSSAFLFILFAILGIAAFSGVLYFLYRAFRKKPLIKRSERTKADVKGEWLTYLKILLVMLGAGVALALLSVTGAFF